MTRLLRVAQECQRLGHEALLRPYATMPYLSTVLAEVRGWDDCGHAVPNQRYARGVPVAKQPALRALSSEWLSSLKEITTVTLFESHISATLFCLPAGTALPIHDHPMMHVLTQVVEGELLAKAYDWDFDSCTDRRAALPELVRASMEDEKRYAKAMEAAASTAPLDASASSSASASASSRLPERSLADVRDLIVELRRMPNMGRHTDFSRTVPNAKVAYKGAITQASGVQWTRPFAGGALHSFRAPASSPVAFIDIITPPYYKAAALNVPCTYYETVIDAEAAGEAAALRRLLEPPPLHMDGYTSALLLP